MGGCKPRRPKLMPGLTRQQLHDFLTSGRRLLKLATLTEDGSPYVVPLWYDYDGEAFSVAGSRACEVDRQHPARRESGRPGGHRGGRLRPGSVPGPRRNPGRRLAALVANARHSLPGRGGRACATTSRPTASRARWCASYRNPCKAGPGRGGTRGIGGRTRES